MKLFSIIFPFDCKKLSFTVDELLDYVTLAKLVSTVIETECISWRSSDFVRACAQFAFGNLSSFAKSRNHII